ncbi:MAG: NTP transferase domain-containing protein [Pseudomonadota bacterium]|nr:NTP transferase domain-containing protein [Pseudomonadota bacterium]
MPAPADTLPVLILAGGASRRMGGRDKALAELAGRRLIDIVVERLRPQARVLAISGPGDYATGLEAIPDRADGPRGPAAGLWAMSAWMAARLPGARGFCTAPVDGPFAPHDLVARLSSAGGCAVAHDGENDQPAFALWELAALRRVLEAAPAGEGIALHALAHRCGAARVRFPASSFFNVNAPEDLARAEALLANG